jgi:hypothetical protein
LDREHNTNSIIKDEYFDVIAKFLFSLEIADEKKSFHNEELPKQSSIQVGQAIQPYGGSKQSNINLQASQRISIGLMSKSHEV